jgi:hypothetical protein
MAGNGGKKDADQKQRPEQDAGFGGEMNKSAAGWHDNSPHLIVRIAKPLDFNAWYRKCLSKNWPGVQ